MSFVDIVVWPFARLLEVLYNWTSSYGLAIILFALVVNLILLPFMAKSKKGPPFKAPYFSIASTAYCEQVGINLHLGGNAGETYF